MKQISKMKTRAILPESTPEDYLLQIAMGNYLLEKRDYNLIDYTIEGLVDWLRKIGVIDKNNVIRKNGKLTFQWKDEQIMEKKI